LLLLTNLAAVVDAVADDARRVLVPSDSCTVSPARASARS
jgi:hypothetical protein